MSQKGQLAVVSQFDIENKILDYFVNRFHRPPTEINRNTDLKIHFNFDTDAKWASIAAALSNQDWMISLGVEIEQSEMKDHNTARALAALIWSKVPKLVALSAPSIGLKPFVAADPVPGGAAERSPRRSSRGRAGR